MAGITKCRGPRRSDASKRKPACLGCRSRKKKCDGLRPSCTGCQKWNVICEYKDISKGQLNTAIPKENSNPLDNINKTVAQTVTPPSSSNDSENHSSPANSMDSSGQAKVPIIWTNPPPGNFIGDPTHTLALELLEIFLVRYSVYVPCFRHDSLRTDFREGIILKQWPSLYYAIIAISAPRHQDPAVHASQYGWSRQASSLYALLDTEMLTEVRALQAAACIVMLAYMTADYSTAWIILGQAWRQACDAGLNRIDSTVSSVGDTKPLPLDESDKAELRRVMWTLFILDRDSYPSGKPLAIDLKKFVVSRPINESIFQSASGSRSSGDTPDRSLDLVLEAYVILGKVVDHVYFLQRPEDPLAYTIEHHNLSSLTIRLQMTLQTLLELPELDRRTWYHLVWAGTINATATILLHDRSDDDWLTLRDQTIPLRDQPLKSQLLSQSFAASQFFVDLIRKLPKEYSEAVLNPHTAPAIYTCSRPILLSWHETNHPERRKDISDILVLCDRLALEFPPVGRKFKSGFEFFLEQDEAGIEENRRNGAKMTFILCARWFERSKRTSVQFVPGQLQFVQLEPPTVSR